MLCSQCQHENLPDANFCDACGTPLPSPCARCGSENRPGARFCRQCGQSLTEPTPPPNSSQERSPPIRQEVQPARLESPLVDRHTPEAERRQLTVMFCDLVDSTRLSGQLDPEDLREVVQAYQAACTDVIHRFEGYVAQHLGDGILCYFGYPTAHEDDAQRAVRAGLGMIDAMKVLNLTLVQHHGIQLAVRISVHTGAVVIGGIGAGERQEQLALGEVPNVAARLQGLAEPDMVVISDTTYRLIQGYFDFDTLGERELRGVAQPVVIYRVLNESGAQGRLDVASTRGLTPLVGRESETRLLVERWAQAKDGQGQVVLLSGEAGIGKSRLVQVLKDRVADEPHMRLECRSSPYFTNSAFYPIIDMVQRTLRFQADDTPEQKLEKLEQNLSQYRLPTNETAPLFGALLSLPVASDRYPPPKVTPQRQRQKTLEAIVAIIMELAEQEPVLFILEDAHWLDASTQELLALLIEQAPTSPILTLITYRPELHPPWGHRSYLTPVMLNRLSRNQVEQLATHVAGGKPLPSEVIEQLVKKTDGVPLYCEEMTKAILESGVIKEVEGQHELTGSIASLSIPATLQDSLMARLDRLVTAKAVAQYGSVMGRQFSYELLHAVSQLDEATLQRELGRLVEAELVYQRGVPPQAIYLFKHALVQDTAYQSLLRTTRQGYHRRIAEVLEEKFPETAEGQPELLAHHYTEAGLSANAVAYWQQAGEAAIQHSANVEAIAHLRKGLEVLKTRPATSERHQYELDMLTLLGSALSAIRGPAASEVEQTYAEALELCRQVEEMPHHFPILWGLWQFYAQRTVYPMAQKLSEQLLALSHSTQDPAQYLVAHRALGTTLFYLGELPQARSHLEQGIDFYERQQHDGMAVLHGQDLGVSCFTYAALSLLWLGFPDQGFQYIDQALAIAQDLSHPYTLARTLNFAAMFAHCRRERQTMQERAETALSLATDQSFAFWLAWATIQRGWTLAERGKSIEGLAQIRQGLAAYRATGAEVQWPYLLTMLAEAHGSAGQAEEGLHVLAEARSTMEKSGERFYEAEIHRLRGELLLQRSLDDAAEAESCFQQALSVAHNQQAKSFELRAATSLARLWQQQDKRQDAYDLLAPVYGWFTEGFDTAELKDAKVLLNELEG